MSNADSNAKPFQSPAAWRGDELFTRNDWKFDLTDDETAELQRALASCEQLRIEEITPKNFRLDRLATKLWAVQNALENGSGGCRVRVFDDDRFPVSQFTEDQLKRLFFGLAQYVGTPVSQSAAGERIFSVRNEGYAENDPRSRGPNTKKKLSYHTDRCDVIAFLCLKQAKSGGENHVVSSVTLYNEILKRRPDLLSVLMEPFYYKRHNVDTGNNKPYIQQPVFSIYAGHFAANILRVLIDRAYEMPELPNMTDLQREALDYVEELADDPELRVSFRQEPGDLLLLNNFVTFHRRTEFEDYEDPTQRRHLLRIWLSVPNSRPLDPVFAGNYGTTEAGAIRGGMPPEGGAT
ncbi:MAG: TauD/TfdA family dioxygenase [Planctomycetales bacterium]|nr:TauD/TfdA family dioxygenase [Planctomycetales bacterium]